MTTRKISKTAATPEDEIVARRVWQLHEEGAKPIGIAETLGVPKTLVRDILTGRRLGPPVSERSAAKKARCPFCGKSVLSLPCLACELQKNNITTEYVSPFAKTKVSKTEWELRHFYDVKGAAGRMPKPRYLDKDSVKRIEAKMFCPECCKRRIETPSGLVCPDGHGRIAPKISQQDLRSWEYTKQVDKAPRGRTIRGSSLVYKTDLGYWKRTNQRTPSMPYTEININNVLVKVVPHKPSKRILELDAQLEK